MRTDAGVGLVDPSETGSVDVSPASDSKLQKAVDDRLREEGIVMEVGGFHNNVLCFQAPLSVSRTQLERVVHELEAAIDREA